MKNFARKAAPLNRLLQNDVPWEWSKICQEAFESLKVSMTEAPHSAETRYEPAF
jgi:hypothetical protein